MTEIIKDILFYSALSCGSIFLLCLFGIIIVRMIGFLIDHLTVANVMKECLEIYIKQKNPVYKIKDEDIILKKDVKKEEK